MGQFRRVRRRTITAFTPRKVDLENWNWYDFTCLVIAIVLMLIAVVSLAVTSYYMHRFMRVEKDDTKLKYVEDDGSTDKRKKEPPLDLDLEQTTSLRPLRRLCIYQIVVECIVILVMLFIILWLRYLRNLCVFLFVVIFLVIIMILFLGIGGTATIKRTTDSRILSSTFYHITKHLETGDMYYLYKLYDYQFTHSCCGIHNYTDWKSWNSLVSLPKDGVPNSCCKDTTKGAQALTNACDNDNILASPKNSKLYDKLTPDGCGSKFNKDKHKMNFRAFMIYGYVMAGIYLLFIAFLFFLGYMLYDNLINMRNSPRTNDPREQENDMEDDLIPGTPAKSMMSEDENTFYAP